jgi:hypothetical protein
VDVGKTGKSVDGFETAVFVVGVVGGIGGVGVG